MGVRREKAVAYFDSGYNCAQAVTLAFADLLPVKEEMAAKMASSFGGGMGRLREVCGAVSGMLLVIGFLYGYADPDSSDEKAGHYARVQELAVTFEKNQGSLLCRDLLGLNCHHDSPIPTHRADKSFAERPCRRLVADAAGLLEQYISEHES